MKAKDIKVGEVYAVKVSGEVVPCRVLRVLELPYGWKAGYRTVWECENLATQRTIRVVGVARFRYVCQNAPTIYYDDTETDHEAEADYGGAFDGFNVTSDADPGL